MTRHRSRIWLTGSFRFDVATAQPVCCAIHSVSPRAPWRDPRRHWTGHASQFDAPGARGLSRVCKREYSRGSAKYPFAGAGPTVSAHDARNALGVQVMLHQIVVNAERRFPVDRGEWFAAFAMDQHELSRTLDQRRSWLISNSEVVSVTYRKLVDREIRARDAQTQRVHERCRRDAIERPVLRPVALVPIVDAQ